jgi:hypothetical protein
MASIVGAAIDVILANPDQLVARIAVLEDALQKNPKAAAQLAEARAALKPVEWTEKSTIEALSGLRATAVVTKTQQALVRSYIGDALPAAELDALLSELKAAKGPRNIARLIAKYDGNVISLIVSALTE